MLILPPSRPWALVLIGEVLEAVYATHSRAPESMVREALVRELETRGLGSVPDSHPVVAQPAARIAAGQNPGIDPHWLDES